MTTTTTSGIQRRNNSHRLLGKVDVRNDGGGLRVSLGRVVDGRHVEMKVCLVSGVKRLMWSLGGTPGPIILGYIPSPVIIKLPVWTTPRTTRIQGPSFSHSSVGSSLRWNSDIEFLSNQSDLVIWWTLDPMLHYDIILFPCLCYIFRFLSHDPHAFVVFLYYNE